MDPNERILLKQAVELGEENNRLLKKLVSIQRWTRAMFILKWAIVIALTLGAYYYIQPLVDQAIETYRSLGVTIPEPNSFQNLLRGE